MSTPNVTPDVTPNAEPNLPDEIVGAAEAVAPVAAGIATQFGGTHAATYIQEGAALLPALEQLFLAVASMFRHAHTQTNASK